MNNNYILTLLTYLFLSQEYLEIWSLTNNSLCVQEQKKYEQQLYSYFADIFISLSGIFGDLKPL